MSFRRISGTFEEKLKALTEYYGGKVERASVYDENEDLKKRIAELEMESRGNWIDAEQLAKVLRTVAKVAHSGGTEGMSETNALYAIRELTLAFWDKK